MVSDRRVGKHSALHISLALTGLLACLSIAAQPDQPSEVPPAINTHNVPVTYDPYQFATGKSVGKPVRLTHTSDGTQFVWPNVPAATWDTVLLAVQSWGAESQPWVEVSVGSATTHQYLDPNAIGIRWLNLSGLHKQLVAGAQVTIRAHAVTLGGDNATVRLFRNQLDLREPLLIVAPHPDDAEIAAF